MAQTSQILKNYLEHGKILIAIDSRVQNVQLPTHLMNSIQVKLNLSYHFQTKVFEIDDVKEEVRIDLGFNGERFLCVIPFQSIYYVAMANTPLDGVEIIENMPIQLLELSYLLERESQDREKQIDFMASIPKDKALEIEKKMPKKEIDQSIKDQAFDEFMHLLGNAEIREKFEEINALNHKITKKPITKKASNNEIKFSKYTKKK
jgi:hypothetical protein